MHMNARRVVLLGLKNINKYLSRAALTERVTLPSASTILPS